MDEMFSTCSENTLEITRNPFDSGDVDRDNLPGLSPSVFSTTSTGSAEKGGFRWSIDQIALLKPADIDEFPLQEYSSIYARDEEEKEAQKAIDEYFSTVTLPSPWLEEKEPGKSKRVTFSPHPPSTAYIMDESYESDKSISANDSEKPKVLDACCQTKITFPCNFDLERFLAKFLLRPSANATSKVDTSFTSFRRKLFSGDDSTPGSISDGAKDTGDVMLESPRREMEVNERNVQGSGLITSSPFSSESCDPEYFDDDDVRRSSLMDKSFNSPSLSPLKDCNNNATPTDKDLSSIDENDEPPERMSEGLDIEFRPRGFGISHSTQGAVGQGDSSVFADVESSIKEGLSVECSAEQTWNNKVVESTRVTDIDINSMSPIKSEDCEEEVMEISVSRNHSLDVTEMSCLQEYSDSVKESTARPLHGITYLGLSPIRNNTSSIEGKTQESSRNNVLSGKKFGNEITDDSVPDLIYISDLTTKDEHEEYCSEKEGTQTPPNDQDCTHSYVETPRKGGTFKGILKNNRRSSFKSKQSPDNVPGPETFAHHFDYQSTNLTSTFLEQASYHKRRPLRDIVDKGDDDDLLLVKNRSWGSGSGKNYRSLYSANRNVSLDEDLVIRQANAALCRAEKLHQDVCYDAQGYYDYGTSALLYHAGVTRKVGTNPRGTIRGRGFTNHKYNNVDSGFSTLNEDSTKMTSIKASHKVHPMYTCPSNIYGKENAYGNRYPPRKGEQRRGTWPLPFASRSEPSLRYTSRLTSPIQKSLKVPRSFSTPSLDRRRIYREDH